MMTFGNKRHLVIFHSTSSGLNGADLGSDENEIVFLVYLIVDLETKKVRTISIKYLMSFLLYLLNLNNVVFIFIEKSSLELKYCKSQTRMFT